MSIIRPSDSIFSLSTNDLFKMIASECGEEVVDIVKAQGISNIHSLLGVSDILDFVHLPSPALRDLKMKVAWELTDGSWFIMPGFRARVDLFMNKLRVQVELEDRYHSPSSASLDDITLDTALLVEYPPLASLIRFYTTLRKESSQHDLFSPLRLRRKCYCESSTSSEQSPLLRPHPSVRSLSLLAWRS